MTSECAAVGATIRASGIVEASAVRVKRENPSESRRLTLGNGQAYYPLCWVPFGATGPNPPGVWLTPHAGLFLERAMPDRAVLFIDGNNWFHGLDRMGEAGQKRLDYAKLSQKLVAPRTWTGTRYYVGRVEQVGNKQLYADQRAFVAQLLATDKRISVYFGRIEQRPTENLLADRILTYLAGKTTGIDADIRYRLEAMAEMHKKIPTYTEKATDVYLATDLVAMAVMNEYDAAYVLSADGDYTPAVRFVLKQGKTVYGVSAAAQPGAELAKVVTKSIPVTSAWLRDCY